MSQVTEPFHSRHILGMGKLKQRIELNGCERLRVPFVRIGRRQASKSALCMVSTWSRISPWSSRDRCSLGCGVEADSDLGAIGDVNLVARLQALDEGLHS
jgi:hypothetical protein